MGNSSSSAAPKEANVSTSSSHTTEQEEIKRWEGHVAFLEEQAKKCSEKKEAEGSMCVDEDLLKAVKEKYGELLVNEGDLSAYLGTINARIKLIKAATERYGDSVRNDSSFIQFISILKDCGITEDHRITKHKSGDLIEELIDLFYEEWDLLQKTSLEMIRLKKVANKTKFVIKCTKKEIEGNNPLTKQQCESIHKSLSTWFDGDKNIQALNDSWTEFGKRVGKLQASVTKLFDVVTTKIQEKLLSLPKQICNKCTWANAGITACVGYTLSHVGWVAVTGFAATSFVCAPGALLCFYAGKKMYHKYQESQKIEKFLAEKKQCVENFKEQFDTMEEFSRGIKGQITQLQQTVHSGAGEEQQKLVVEWQEWLVGRQLDDETKADVVEQLSDIIDQLKLFGQLCDTIKKQANDRQEKYANRK